MAASYDSLRHLEVLPADFADFRHMDISLVRNDYTITSEKEGDERTYYYQEDELEIADLQNAWKVFRGQLYQMSAQGRIKRSFDVHLDMETIRQSR